MTCTDKGDSTTCSNACSKTKRQRLAAAIKAARGRRTSKYRKEIMNKFITPIQLCEVLGIGRTQVCRLLRDGRIKGWRVPGKRGNWRITIEECKRLADMAGVPLRDFQAKCRATKGGPGSDALGSSGGMSSSRTI